MTEYTIEQWESTMDDLFSYEKFKYDKIRPDKVKVIKKQELDYMNRNLLKD